jgi:hypothetical protein
MEFIEQTMKCLAINKRRIGLASGEEIDKSSKEQERKKMHCSTEYNSPVTQNEWSQLT